MPARQEPFNDTRFSFGIAVLLDGVLKGNLIRFSSSESPPLLGLFFDATKLPSHWMCFARYELWTRSLAEMMSPSVPFFFFSGSFGKIVFNSVSIRSRVMIPPQLKSEHLRTILEEKRRPRLSSGAIGLCLGMSPLLASLLAKFSKNNTSSTL